MRVVSSVVLLLLAFPTLASAADDIPNNSPTLVFNSNQFWIAVIGALVPLVTYGLNHFAPWATEPVKATVLFITSAIAGALYELLQAGSLGFNTPTYQAVGTAVLFAFLAHNLAYRPGAINTRLGGGSNHSGAEPA